MPEGRAVRKGLDGDAGPVLSEDQCRINVVSEIGLRREHAGKTQRDEAPETTERRARPDGSAHPPSATPRTLIVS